MDAFAYPPESHRRRHGPRGYQHAESYRPWLRDEFDFRCVYCLLRERWVLARGTFALDHFLPVATHPQKALAYDNLVYACCTCNFGKGRQTLPNPESALVAGDVHVNDDGSIVARSPTARRIVRVLGLDSPEYTDFRSQWLGIIALARAHDPALYRKLMGYPDDLPTLARLRPPGGNARATGIGASCHVRKEQGTLPETY